MSFQRKYTIQEIRDLLVTLEDGMNPYKRIDAANGIHVVQRFLGALQEVSVVNEEGFLRNCINTAQCAITYYEEEDQ